MTGLCQELCPVSSVANQPFPRELGSRKGLHLSCEAFTRLPMRMRIQMRSLFMQKESIAL